MKKIVEYAYPTSTSATRFGFGKTGCYVVQLWNMIKPPKVVAGFATKEEAIKHAETLQNEWHPLHFKYINEL